MSRLLPHTARLLLLVGVLVWSGCAISFDPPADVNPVVKNDASTASRVVIVPGYGAPVVGNERYEAYIRTVATYVTQHADEIDQVIFTGSYSALPDLSEADAMQQYFATVMSPGIIEDQQIEVLTEECAIMSWQNIKHSQALVAERGLTPTAVTVFGDQARQDKLVAFANYYFNKQSAPTSAADISNLRYTPIDFQGFDFGGDAGDPALQAQAAAELILLTDESASRRLLAERIAQWSAQFHYDVATNLVGNGCREFTEFATQ